MSSEAEWLASDDPRAMLRHLTHEVHRAEDAIGDCPRERPLASDRKLRLFACACCRLVWDRLSDEQTRRAVEVAERCADGLTGPNERGKEMNAVDNIRSPTMHAHAAAVLRSDAAIGAREIAEYGYEDTRLGQAALLRDVVGNPFRPVRLPWEWLHRRGKQAVLPADPVEAERLVRGGKLVCEWLTPAVLSLARAAYDERLPDGTLDRLRLAVLADALEEAGCAERAVLEHLRGWRPYPVDGWLRDASSTTHVRGCWAVDLILGRN